MAEWATVRYDPDYTEKIDEEILPLCDLLNTLGFVTTQSCCGHGTNWPSVWFEHSSDERIESMARFVLKAEEKGGGHFTVFRKQVFLDYYEWQLEIHMPPVFVDTSQETYLRLSVNAITQVADLIREWGEASSKKRRIRGRFCNDTIY